MFEQHCCCPQKTYGSKLDRGAQLYCLSLVCFVWGPYSYRNMKLLEVHKLKYYLGENDFLIKAPVSRVPKCTPGLVGPSKISICFLLSLSLC